MLQHRSSCASIISGQTNSSSGDPTLDYDGIYFRARAVVCVDIEKITDKDFLRGLLRRTMLSPHPGSDQVVDPSIANVFAVASYRFGYSLLTSTTSRLLDANNQSVGDLLLDQAFFPPTQITSVGVEPDPAWPRPPASGVSRRPRCLQRAELLSWYRVRVRLTCALTCSAGVIMACRGSIRFASITWVCLRLCPSPKSLAIPACKAKLASAYASAQ